MKQKLLKSLALAGTLCLGSQMHAQNEFYNNGADVYVQAGGLVYVQGEVINDDEGAFIGRIYNSGDVQLEGNWTNTSVSNVYQWGDPGTTTFLGTNAVQTIGGTTDTYFNNLTLNKPGGTKEVRLLRNSLSDGAGIFALNDDFMNTQTFVFGVANVATTAITRLGGNVPDYMHSTVQGYVTSTVGSAGRLSRATMPGGTYLFPVGTAARWRPVEITPSAGVPNTYFVQFVDMPTPNTNLKAPTLATINPAWYHFMERASAGSPENIRIYHEFIADDICDINNVTMSEWNTAIWDDLSPTTSNNPAPFMSWTQKTGYPGAYPTPWVSNMFALAGLFLQPNVMSCVFPVEIIELKATPQENSILLTWETASETNNQGFEIQRSTDNLNFSTIGWVDGAGNSQTFIPYDYDDKSVARNIKYYYRLRQLDFNGGASFSNVVEGILLDDGLFSLEGFFPNPSTGNTSLWLSMTEPGDLEVTMFDAIGKLVYNSRKTVDTGATTLNFDFSHLAAGSYFAQIKVRNQVVHKKLILD